MQNLEIKNKGVEKAAVFPSLDGKNEEPQKGLGWKKP